MIKEIVDKIIELLKADSSLNFNWYFEPPVRAPSFPYGFVDFVSGEVLETTKTKTLFNLVFYITVVDWKRSNDDNVERAQADRIEKIHSILKANRQLGGQVLDSDITSIAGDYYVTEKGNMLGVRLTFVCRAWL